MTTMENEARKSGRRRKMITNRQASYLASLQHDLGRPYSGRGMTQREASAAIKATLRELRKRRSA